jgi:carboxyl-terminal processing protease
MMSKNKLFVFLFFSLQIFVILGAFGLGFIIAERSSRSPSASFPVLDEAFSLINKYGLREITDDMRIEYGMIRGLVQAYGDPFTSHIEPAQHELQTNQLTGSYGGIGSLIEIREDGHYYLLPYPNSPASNAGLQQHDRLFRVEGKLITDYANLDEIIADIRGEVDTKVSITVLRSPDYQIEETFSIERAEVPLPSVLAYLDDDYPQVGVININIIADTTSDELSQAIESLQDHGADRILIDLRNNGGGLLDSGISLAKLFLEKDQIIINQQAKGEEIKTIRTNQNGQFRELPLMILVNENTASAAEIFAGALQANQRSLLVGKNTYGKNTIQLVFDLQDQSSMHITNARWWFPDLPDFTEGSGLQPDVSFDEIDGMDPSVYETAVELLLALP